MEKEMLNIGGNQADIELGLIEEFRRQFDVHIDVDQILSKADYNSVV